MAEYNPNVLGTNLGQLALAQSQAYRQDQQNLQTNIGNLGTAIGSGVKNYRLNSSLNNNFNTETGELNQQGVVADLFNADPQTALALQQQFKSQQASALKAQSELAKEQAQMSLYRAQANEKQTEAQTKQLNSLAQMISASDSQESMDRAIAYAKSKGLSGTELFEGQKYSSDVKQRALSLVLDAKTQLELPIKQQNANAQTSNAETARLNSQIQLKNSGIQQQNADTNRMEAENKFVITPYQQEQLRISQQNANTTATNAGNSGKQVVDNQNGLFVVNTKTNEITPVKDSTGQNAIGVKQSKEIDEAKNKIRSNKASIDSFNNSLKIIDRLSNNPALENVTGPAGGFNPGVTGAQRNAIADLSVVTSNQFLSAVEKMRGLGALTDAEGKRLENAIASLDRKQSYPQMLENINIIKSVIGNVINTSNKQIEAEEKKLPKSEKVNQSATQNGPTDEQLASRGLTREKYNFLMSNRQ